MRWLPILFLLGIPAMAEFRVGAAKRVITPDLKKFSPVYLGGFGQNRVATGVHDDLYARCIAFDDGKSAPLVVCGVDSIGLFAEDVKRIRAKAGAMVIVAALHDHQSPDTMGLWGPAQGTSGINEQYNTMVIDQTAAAAKEALAKRQPAEITLAKAHPAELDTFIHDTRPPEVHDAEVIVLLAKAKRGGLTIGTLLNWANHPETLGSRNTLLTADYSAALYRELEKQYGGTTVFVNGAVGGMQSPLGAKLETPENSFERAEFIGRRVAQIAGDVLRDAQPVKVDAVQYREEIVHIPITNQGFLLAAKANLYRGRKPATGDKTETSVGLMRLLQGKTPVLEAALIPGELYPELSVGGVQKFEGADFPEAAVEPPIKSKLTAPYKMLFGLANDEIGYIIPKQEWDEKEPWLQDAPKRWYGEVNSVGPDAASILIQALDQLIHRP